MQNLYVYVFDDNESDLASYIGRAAIPLYPLLQNKPIKGIFGLENVRYNLYHSFVTLVKVKMHAYNLEKKKEKNCHQSL